MGHKRTLELVLVPISIMTGLRFSVASVELPGM